MALPWGLHWASARLQLENVEGAWEAHQQALALLRALTGDDMANSQWQRDLGIAHQRLGEVLWRRNERDAAWQEYYAYYECSKQQAVLYPKNEQAQRDLLTSYSFLGFGLTGIVKAERGH